MKSTLDNLTNRTHKDLYKDNEPDGFVYLKYHEFLATGKYPYLAEVGKFIKGFLPELTAVQESNLESHIYYSSKLAQYDAENAHEWAMLADGWRLIDDKEVEAIVKSGHKKVRCIKKGHNILGFSTETDDIYKIFVANDNTVYLMKPRARRKGWLASHFYGAFYKVA